MMVAVDSYLPKLRGQVRALVRRRHPDGAPAGFLASEFDEAYSVALVGLARAVADFDPARGASFETFAFRCVRHALVDHLWASVPLGYRRGDRRAGAAAAAAEVAVVPASEVADVADDRPPVGWEVDWEDWVRAVSRGLPPRHGALIRAHYLRADGLDLAGCAAILGLRVARVVQLHREALALLAERHAPRAP
jgi:RNA polymerase sigma factor (sigma-70 family)